MKSIGEIFGDKWPLYQRAIRSNVLCHDEMFSTLDRLLINKFGDRPIHFADFGCGDATAALQILRDKKIAGYTGVDASRELIQSAQHTLAPLQWHTNLICQDMVLAIHDVSGPFDVILCSYSLHHLMQDQKAEFISNCFHRLNSPGYFVMIDGVAGETETREEWLHRLDRRFLEKVPDFTDEERAQIMQHPWDYDHPERISTFRTIARQDLWRNFEVVRYLDDFLAFLLYEK